MTSIRPLLLVLGLAFAAPAIGCSKTNIPNTDVEDSSDNRKVIAFCEKYRRAVEDRDVDTLISMVSPRYFETGGNAKSGDDIDYNGLRQYLTTKFKQTKAIRYEIKYHRVHEEQDKIIRVEFTYSASFQIPAPGGDMWHRAVRDNQLRLVRDQKNDTFKIIGGM